MNGKLRGKAMVPTDTDQETAYNIALANPQIARFIEGNIVQKVVLVPGRLLNIVVS